MSATTTLAVLLAGPPTPRRSAIWNTAFPRWLTEPSTGSPRRPPSPGPTASPTTSTGPPRSSPSWRRSSRFWPTGSAHRGPGRGHELRRRWSRCACPTATTRRCSSMPPPSAPPPSACGFTGSGRRSNWGTEHEVVTGGGAVEFFYCIARRPDMTHYAALRTSGSTRPPRTPVTHPGRPATTSSTPT